MAHLGQPQAREKERQHRCRRRHGGCRGRQRPGRRACGRWRDPALTAVSAALAARGGRTTAELAEAAKVGQSTAAKILASLEKRGVVRRIKGGRQGARMLPDRWEPMV